MPIAWGMTQTNSSAQPPIATGRGAWTLRGGLLPAKAGSTGRTGYYRLAGAGETPIGSPYATGAERGQDATVVNAGVRAIQSLVGLRAKDVDGWFGPATAAAVLAAQSRLGVEADAVVGPSTMKALLGDLVRDIAGHNNVPYAILGGLIVTESGLDPAAVGANATDTGLAQINLAVHDVSQIEALDPAFALTFAAADLSHMIETWTGHTSVDPAWIAIANHNSPKLARTWARSGIAPFVAGRLFQIEDYVKKVLTAW